MRQLRKVILLVWNFRSPILFQATGKEYKGSFLKLSVAIFSYFNRISAAKRPEIPAPIIITS